MDVLKVQYISQAQAVQRSGRAGRQGPGICYRLFREDKFKNLQAMQTPEILRCNLLSVCLDLFAMGIKNLPQFDFIDKPSVESIHAAIDQLVWLGAVDEKGRNSLTEQGYIMARFPLDPTLSKALITAEAMGCLKETIIAVSMLSVDSVFHIPISPEQEQKQNIFRSDDGDHVTLVNVYLSFISNGCNKSWCLEHKVDCRNLNQAKKIVDQLTDIIDELGWDIETHGQDTEPLRICLASGLFFKAAMLQPDKSYKAVMSSREVHIHPSSCLFPYRSATRNLPPCVIYTELVQSSKSYMR